MNVNASGSAACVLMDMYYNSPSPATVSTPLVARNTFRPCSVRGCPRLLSDESTNTMCDPCSCGESAQKSREKAAVTGGAADSMTVNNWLDLNSLEESTSDSVRESPSQLAATTVPNWTQSIDPRLFSTPVHLDASSVARATSELANALVMPATAQGVTGELPNQDGSGSNLSRSIRGPGSKLEVRQTDGDGVDSYGQMRFCSVRGCKQTVPVDYEYKMCPACRVRYQKYGTTKRAKWKVERDKEKQAGYSVSEDSEAPGPEDTPPAQRPPTPSSVQPQPHMHQPTCASFIQEQLPRPSSAPSPTGYLESDPIVNGFSKFRVELFEGELHGRHTEGTVMSAPDVMTLGASSNADQRIGTDPQPPSSVSFGRTSSTLSGEHPVKNASGVDSSKETPNATGYMTRPIVPVSLSVCHPDAERDVAPGQNNTQPQDGPSSQPLPTTAVPTPKPKGKRKAAKGTGTTLSTPRSTKSSSSHTAPPPQGYPAPHPYLYPYYPMYFPPYPGAYQYPYLPMPFAPPPSSPSKTKKRKKPVQATNVVATPLPPPAFTYPYPPGHSGVWSYPTQPPPAAPAPPSPITSPFPQASTSVTPVNPAPPPQLSPPPPASALYAIPPPYPLPAFHQPPQGPSVSAPSVAQCPRVSGTQPYSGTPLTTLMPVPFFSVGASATVPSAGGSRKDKGKGAENDGTREEMGREPFQIHAQKPPHVQMQFNYYHYGVGSSQSPTTPEAHARRKRRKVDPQYREKLEIFRAQAKAPANPDPSVPFAQGQSNAPVSSTCTAKQGASDGDGDGNLDEEPTLRQCSNKDCMRVLPLDGKISRRICKKCKIKFKKRTERTKERFRLIPKKTVCDRLGKVV